jgi:hypothetical protein
VLVRSRHWSVLLFILAAGVSTLACEAVTRWLPASPALAPTFEAAALPPASPTPMALAELDVPPPALFETAWLDRAVYRSGLVESEQAILGSLPGAPVYHLDLSLSDDLASITGRQEVLFTNTEDVPLDRIVFRLYPNLLGGAIAVTQLAVDGTPVDPLLEGMDSVMTVPLDGPLLPGERAVVSMAYEIDVPTETSGNYGVFGLAEGVLALPHLYPMLAVYDETGWNTDIPPEYGDVVYADSGFYRVRIDAPPELVQVTSGVEVDRSEAEGRSVREYAAGPVRDFYLAGSPDFVSEERQVDGIRVRSTTLPGLEAGARNVLDFTETSLLDFAERYGAYPFVELDMVSTPTLALGVEYPGVVAMAQRMYPEDNPQYPLPMLESVTAHEVAHQWFYSLVGNDQIDQPWLDESLAQYVTLLYFGDQYGPPGAAGYRASLEGRWDQVGREPIPIGQPVGAYTPAEYSGIVYGRGGLFFEAIADEIGQVALDQGLRAYAEQNRYGNGTSQEMQAAFESACGCDLDALFAAWVGPVN